LETSLIGKALDFGSNECGFESRVSSMPYNTPNYVANHINIANSKKLVSKSIILTKDSLRLIKILHNYGVVHRFVITRNPLKRLPTHLITFTTLVYKNKPFFRGVKIVTTPSRKHTITINALRRASHSIKESLVLISTPFGVISHKEALAYKIGGQIFAILH
jgi:ribosomal protein S8